MLLPLALVRMRVLIIGLALIGTVALAAANPWRFASAAKSNLPYASPAPLASPEQSFVRKVEVVANDVVVDPITQTIYVSIPSSSLPNGNSIAAVTGVTGAVGPSVFLGSEPTKLAVSDNGQYIYALLNGSASIRRFEIATQTAGLQFSLGQDSFGSPLTPVDLLVQPSNPNTLAIQRQGSSSGIAIYDSGVPRSASVNTFSAQSFTFNNIDASRLYGLGSGTLIRMVANASGVTQTGTSNVSGGGAIRFDNGRLYAASGQVLDPETGTLFGTFTGTNINSSTIFTTDSAINRAFYLTSSGFSGTQTLTLRVFDLQTFLPLGTLDIPSVQGAPTRIVRWGSNGLAFRTSAGQLFIIQTTLVSSGDPIPTPTPTPTATPTPTPVPTPGPNELRQISLPTNDLVTLPNGLTIFASVPSSGGGIGNSLTPINPVAGTLGQSIFVGSEPNKLAISSGGQTIYVGLDGANAVRPFDVPTLTPGTQFTLGSEPFYGPNRAEDIAVAPDQPGVVAVSLIRPNVSPRHGGVAVFDNGVQRGLPTASHTGSNVIEFSNSPAVLYGYNNETTEFGFRRMAVASCGPVIVRTTNLFGGFGVDFKYANGAAYSNTGRVINPEAASILGTFLLRDPSIFSSGAPLVLPDPQAGRIYFVLDDNGTFFLRVFDSKTFLKLGEVRLPGVSGTLRGLVRWGTNGIAFRSPTTVYLLQNSLIGVADPGFTPAPIESPATVSRTVTVSSFNGDRSGVTINVTGSTTTSGTTDSAGRITFTGLPPCGGFTFTPSKPNYTFNPTSITVTNISTSPSVEFTATLKTLSFQQSSTTVSESATRISLFVTRNFSTSAATVKYETVAGTASDRSDFNTTLGTLQFATGEQSKIITVLLNNDTLVEGPEAFTVILKDLSEGVLTPGFSTVTVNITDNDTQQGALNPLSDVAFFVRQHYTDFLNREPDAAGLAFWSNQITSCPDAQCREVRRINVSAAFFLAIEFQETGYLVYRMNKAGFGNLPGAPVPVRFTDFLRDSQQIAQGVQVGVGNWQAQLEANKQAFTLAFVQRSEFLAAFPNTMTATQFVDKLNTNAGGALSPGERDTLIATLTTPADVTQRAGVVRAVADDQDLRNAELNKAFVLTQYFGYLRRNPNDAPDTSFDGWQFWLNKLNEFNGNYVQAEMVKSFLVSEEYQLRFGAANFNLGQ